MAKISLSEGFSVISEGEHIFKITEVIYKEEFGKLEVNMVTAKGQKHTERFNFISSNGSPCEGAINAFSFFAKTALNDFSIEEIDHNDLVGCFIKCKVEHEVVPSNKDPNRTVTFARLTDKSPASGFDTPEVVRKPIAQPVSTPSTPTASAKPTQSSFNLDDILG